MGDFVALQLVLFHIALEHLDSVADLLVRQVRHLLSYVLAHLKYF